MIFHFRAPFPGDCVAERRRAEVGCLPPGSALSPGPFYTHFALLESHRKTVMEFLKSRKKHSDTRLAAIVVCRMPDEMSHPSRDLVSLVLLLCGLRRPARRLVRAKNVEEA